MLIIESQASELKINEEMVNAMIIAAKILKIGPNFIDFSESLQVSGTLVMAIPRIALAIQPATILTTAISIGQDASTNMNTPIYCTPRAPIQYRQSLLIKM
jgi:hypothetical protein